VQNFTHDATADERHVEVDEWGKLSYVNIRKLNFNFVNRLMSSIFTQTTMLFYMVFSVYTFHEDAPQTGTPDQVVFSNGQGLRSAEDKFCFVVNGNDFGVYKGDTDHPMWKVFLCFLSSNLVTI